MPAGSASGRPASAASGQKAHELFGLLLLSFHFGSHDVILGAWLLFLLYIERFFLAFRELFHQGIEIFFLEVPHS